MEKRIIDGEGGCPYEIIEGKIDKEKWKFWNKKGTPMKANDELIEEFESCKINYS